MNLMTLIRLVALLAIAWVLVAMGAGILGVGAHSASSPTYFSWNAAAHDAALVAHPEDRSKEEYHLVDRTTGRTEPLVVPAAEKWGLLSVSPWRDQDGKLEAAGRWVSRVGESEKMAFCGMGLFRVSDGTVLGRVNLEVLPTGRPCWVPGRPREFLFPAGDGQLHRCRLNGDGDDGTPPNQKDRRAGSWKRAGELDPVAWRCERPGPGETYLADPEWSPDPRLRPFVIVSLRRQEEVGGKRVYAPSTIWWLQMSEDADAIVAAGRLTASGSRSAALVPLVERFPSVSVGSDGRLTLVYLTRGPGASSWRLCQSALELDPKTGKPALAPDRALAEVLGEGLAPAHVIPSTDGRSVYASAAAGQILKYPRPAAR